MNARETVGLIGPNGAGKTTIFNLVTGLDRPDAGEVYFRRQHITRLPAHRIVNLGISRTFQNIRLLGRLSALDNVKIAHHGQIAYNFLRAALRLPRFFAVEKDIAGKSMQFLELVGMADAANLERACHYFPILAERRRRKAGTLSGGEQQMLAVARCLMASPALLMLDEPSLGLAPMILDQIFDIIRRINRENRATVFLVEQNANEALARADRGYVLENGTITLEGAANELLRNPQVIEAYLGG
ncbi:MAG: ATP-binding cassette domain-containing protein [Verrucomicrobiota bacterium]|nr:ATP-binding cassette domain-containing protein [Verrucomicrobiota bacterium]